MVRCMALAALTLLGGCSVIQQGPDLVSAQTPPGTGLVNDASEPQPPNSLPPGAAVSGPGPGATQHSYLTRTFWR
jgi:hypothetical protein